MLLKLSSILLFFSMLLQNGNFNLVSTLPTDCDFFSVDNLGNTYHVKDNVLIKRIPNGSLANIYSSKVYGTVTSIDTRNPLQIIVFYPDLSHIVFLDNTLSIHEVVELEQYQLEQVSLVCSSASNSFWVYDQATLQLIRYDRNMNRIQESGNIIQNIGKEIDPNFMTEYNNHLYLNDPQIGILIFDIFGTYVKTIPIMGLNQFQINGETLFYSKNGSIYSFNKISLNEQVIPYSMEFEQATVGMNTLYTLSNGNLRTYSLEIK